MQVEKQYRSKKKRPMDLSGGKIVELALFYGLQSEIGTLIGG